MPNNPHRYNQQYTAIAPSIFANKFGEKLLIASAFSKIMHVIRRSPRHKIRWLFRGNEDLIWAYNKVCTHLNQYDGITHHHQPKHDDVRREYRPSFYRFRLFLSILRLLVRSSPLQKTAAKNRRPEFHPAWNEATRQSCWACPIPPVFRGKTPPCPRK